MTTQSQRLAAVEQRLTDHEARCEERLAEIKATVASTLEAVEGLKNRTWGVVAALLAWALAQVWTANTTRLERLEAAKPPAVRQMADMVTTLRPTAARTEEALLGDRVMSLSGGYRRPPLNRAGGCARTPARRTGHAVDFNCRALAASKLAFDQRIEERAWVLRPGRRAHAPPGAHQAAAGGYVLGLTTGREAA